MNAKAHRQAIALNVFLASFCFVLIYTSITAFEWPTPRYHAQVSYQIILAASLLFLPFMFLRSWTLAPLIVEWRPWLAVALCLGMATVFSADAVVSVPRLRLIYSVFLVGFLLRAWFERADAGLTVMVLFSFALVHAAILTLVLVMYGQREGELFDYAAWVPYHSHLRHVGYHGMVAAAAGFALAVMNSRLRVIGALLATFALFGMIFFGSRGAVLSWVIFLGCAALLGRSRGRVLLTGGTLLLAAWGVAELAGNQLRQHVGTVTDRVGESASVYSRLDLWRQAIEATLQRPLLGYGPEGYSSSACCVARNIQAHNAVAEILIETGVLGLLAFAWLAWRTLGTLAIEIWRARSIATGVQDGKMFLFSAIVGMLAYSMIDGIVYHVIPLLQLAILCALVFSRPRAA